MKMLFLNIKDYKKIDLIQLIQIMLIALCLEMSLLNARSLKKHVVDISRARQITENDIVYLTESQTTNNTDVTEVLGQ